MSGISALNSGLSGIQQGYNNLKQDAQAIATANGNPGKKLEEPMVGLIQDRNQVAASAKVVETVDDTIGTLLDVMA